MTDKTVTELVERLEDEEKRLAGRSIERGCVDSGLAANLALEAATTLTQQAAEIEAKDHALREAKWFMRGGCYLGDREIQRKMTEQKIDTALTGGGPTDEAITPHYGVMVSTGKIVRSDRRRS